MGRKLFAVVGCAALVVPAVADAQESTSSTTSTTSTTARPRSSTTTTPPVPYEPEPDPEPPAAGADEESVDVYELPPSAGPALPVDLAGTTFDPRAAAAYAQWNQARAELDALRAASAARAGEVARFVQAQADAEMALSAAKAAMDADAKALRRFVAAVYMNPSVEPNAETRRGQLVAQLRDVLVGSYARDKARVSELRKVADTATEAAANAARFASAPTDDAALRASQSRVDSLAAALRLFAVGATGTPPGFRFPVGSSYRFANSWGAPRMAGTSFAHGHQGVDVFAADGAPLLAVEAGTIVRRGTNRLGGLKLWLVGDSGYAYYYAHLAGFVHEVVDGTRVAAGQTIGFVGSTGNAKGGAPHLHFEVHVGGAPVNPFPLLAVAASGDPRNLSARRG